MGLMGVSAPSLHIDSTDSMICNSKLIVIVSIQVKSMNTYHKNSKEGKMVAVTSHRVSVKSLSGAVTHPVSFFCEIVVVSCTT